MLRWLGFDKAAILDGGIEHWQSEGNDVEAGANAHSPAELAIAPRPDLFCGKDRVLDAMSKGARILNALDQDLHAGTNPWYGRSGRIPGSTNLRAKELAEANGLLVGPSAAAAAFEAVGLAPEKPVVNYCGGGIAATLDAFLQVQLGYQDVTVYDASMSEWAKDETLPVERD